MSGQPHELGVAALARAFQAKQLEQVSQPAYLATQNARLAQAHALLDIHAQACAQAAQPPLADETGGPFQSKVHTPSAVLCGDFNFEMASDEYALLTGQQPTDPPSLALCDAWPLAHGSASHDPTFRLFDRRYGPEPICCDFVFVSDDLKSRVRQMKVNLHTRASDHQPVLLELT